MTASIMKFIIMTLTFAIQKKQHSAEQQKHDTQLKNKKNTQHNDTQLDNTKTGQSA